MNKLLVITVLVALLAINAESFRVARQAEEEAVVEAVEAEPEVVAEAEPEVVAEAEPEVVAEAEPEAVPEPVPETLEEVPEAVPEAVPEVPEAVPEVPEAVPEVPEAVPEAAPGTLGKMTNAVKYYYGSSVDTASAYLESVRGLKLEEKAKNLYDDTTKAMKTYTGIMQDQVYHLLWPSQDQ